MRGALTNGAAVMESRGRKGWTQDELAQSAKLDVKTVRKAEQGKRIDFVPLTRLAYALDVDIQALLAPSDDEALLQMRRRDAVIRWVMAFDIPDVDALLTAYADDAVLRIPGAPEVPCAGVFRGKDEIRKAHEAAWAMTRHEPIGLDEVTIHVSGKTITLRGDKGFYTPDGRLVRFTCIHLFTFADVLVAEHEVQYDTLDFAKQIPAKS